MNIRSPESVSVEQVVRVVEEVAAKHPHCLPRLEKWVAATAAAVAAEREPGVSRRA